MIYVFTDIHGCYKEFTTILNKLDIKNDDQFIFLGDYIDRGPDSYKVVEKVLELKDSYNTITLLGNHEDMMLNNKNLWMMNGGGATQRSYVKELMSEFYIPDSHKNFYNSLKLFYETDDFIFVHAGFDIDYIEKDYMLWAREEFYLHKPNSSGKVVVFGHTPFKTPFLREGRIGIDTGCFYTGILTCLKIDDDNNTTFITNED